MGDGIDIPIYVRVGFMERGLFNQQHQFNDRFYRRSLVKAQCIFVSENFPDARLNCNCAIDN